MNILVLGSGGREHAITWALAKSPRIGALYVAPGNGGTDGLAVNVDIDMMDAEAVLDFVRERISDWSSSAPRPRWSRALPMFCARRAWPCSARTPTARSSKARSPTRRSSCWKTAFPRLRTPSSSEEPALAYVREEGAPIVIKADGLAAGKGVIVAETLEDAEEAVRECFDGAFGSAGATVVIEEMLDRPRVLLAVLRDGREVLPHAACAGS